MVPRCLFLELGGFSERYSPAYYEDTDLAFQVREAGYRVLYQPMSWVVHYEGVTAGTDTSKGVKAYQERNRDIFFERWKTVLAGHGTADSLPLNLAADRRPRGRLLLIDHCTPTPDQDSGSVDLVNYIRLLDGLGYRVTFIPDSDRLHFGRYTDALQARGVECLYHPFLKSVSDVLSRRGAEFDVVMLMRGPLAYRYIDEVRKRCPHAKCIFNTVDLHFLREQRRAALETGDPDSQAARDARREELYVTRRADATIVISPVEKTILESEVPEAQVEVIPLIREVEGSGADFSARSGLLFVGGFQHPPNVDAVRWLCQDIWPVLRSRLPSVRLTIVGSKLTPEVAALADDDIDVLGYVEDLTPLLAGARLSLAPLRYGAGQKGKVVGSLSHGLPCIATSVAAEGLGLGAEDGILVGDTVDEFAEATVRAYTDAVCWDRLSRNGLSAVEREFSLDANRRRLQELLLSLHLPA
jgi:glycosyltransferase involved in cell wall biosynthesis